MASTKQRWHHAGELWTNKPQVMRNVHNAHAVLLQVPTWSMSNVMVLPEPPEDPSTKHTEA